MAYPKPNVKWIPSPNYGYESKGTKDGRYGEKVIAIVDHIMAGTLAGTDSWFSNTKSSASAHFGIGKNGEIHQYVAEENCAWANGKVAKPSWSMLDKKPGINANWYTISIEHEGQPQDGLTEQQYQATLELHKYLVDKYNIPIDNDHIIGHNRIDGVDRPNCPGNKFPWARLYADLLLWKNPPKDPNQWKIDIMNAGYDLGMFTDKEGWIKKMDEPAPVWAVVAFIKNMYDKQFKK